VTIELRDLQWAIVVSEHPSIRQAAEALNVRQSTLSRGLRDLEHQLGIVVFERTTGGTRPTIDGREFLEGARWIVEGAEALALRLKARSRGESGRLTIGVHTSLSTGNLRATLVEYRKRFPDVAIYLVDGSSDHLISGLARSAVDIAFVADGSPRWEGNSLSVWSERVVIALPKSHPLVDRDVVYWSDLKEETFLLPQRGPGPEFLRLLISKLGYAEPNRLLRHDVSLDRFLSLVGTGWGILLVLEGATGGTFPGVVFREMHDSDGPTRLSFHAYWRQSSRKPSLESFLDLLRQRYPDLSAEPADR
jgi:DNA-binding transcriptional LysR family regulator